MQILVDNPTLQTIYFGAIFIVAILLSTRLTPKQSFFDVSKTLELKGFAILAIIFSHIGYFLSKDTAFLFPFSVDAGVGVNLFLFLSGFGLTISSLKHYLFPWDFYKKRLIKLFIPMWIVISTFLILDFTLLNKSYNLITIIQSFMGYFPTADLYRNIDSPLWYFSLILLFYLIYPLFFWRRFNFISPFLITIFCYFLLRQSLPDIRNTGVLDLYKVHYLSFPLGVFFALFLKDKNFVSVRLVLKRILFNPFIKYPLISIMVIVFIYFSINSGVGEDKFIEQAISLIIMFSAIFVFVLKDFEFKLFNLFGKYSYEIYLIHWPILYRYDIFYKYLPAYLATILYLILFLILGYTLNKLTKRVSL